MLKVPILVLVLLSVAKASFTQEESWKGSLDTNKAMKFTTKRDLRNMNSATPDTRSVDRYASIGGGEVHKIILPTLFGSFVARDKRNESLSYPRGLEIQAACSSPTMKNGASSLIRSYKQSDGDRTAAHLSTRMQTAGQRESGQRQHSEGYPPNSVITFARCLPSPRQFYLRKLSMLCVLPVQVVFLAMCSTTIFLILVLFVQLLFRSKYIEQVLDHCFNRFVIRFLLISIGILVLNGVFLFIGCTACFVYESAALIFLDQNSKRGVYKCIFEYPVKVLWVLLRELNKTKGHSPYVHSSFHVRYRRNG